MVHLCAATKRRTASPRDQCDRSAVGPWWSAVPRVARRLVALARARPTAISSTAPRSQTPVDRSAVANWATTSTTPRSRILVTGFRSRVLYREIKHLAVPSHAARFRKRFHC